MNSRQSAVTRLLLMVVFILTLPGPAQAAPQAVPELYVFPLEGAPGARLYLNAFDLPEGNYQIQIWDGLTRDKTSLGSFNADLNGHLSGTAELPDLPPGDYSVFS